MGLFTGLFLIVCGFLGAANFFVSKKPDAQKLVDVLAPYQGWIGFSGAIWGFIFIVYAIIKIGWISSAFLWWLTMLASGVVLFGTGIILGYNLLNQYIFSKNPKMEQKGVELKEKLTGIQIPMSFASIGVGIWTILYAIIR